MIKQAVILAGGFGTRISEETDNRPKPMIELNQTPILLHIMNWYSKFGVTDFIILGGYKVNIIKNYFLNYHSLNSDFTVNLQTGEISFCNKQAPDWQVSVYDTGLNTMTGGRLKRVEAALDDVFYFTYGDGLSNVDLFKLQEHHEKNDRLVTLTRVISPERFGILELEGDRVHKFSEKPIKNDRWINAGYFVVNRDALKYIQNDETSWESEPLQTLALANELNSYAHTGFWKPMDTLRDKVELEQMMKAGNAPWLD